MGGSIFLDSPYNGLLKSARRIGTVFKSTAAGTRISQTAMPPRSAIVQYPRHAATAMVDTQSLTRKYANTQKSDIKRRISMTPTFFCRTMFI
jgi:hypothetical protein